ncbi:hypothetical protein BC833DRAFT_611179 [Globomyces pollinis-pini]|nr:hypothetical protein BC833DRAFT_611179 [Globomyces pollinis-pini]
MFLILRDGTGFLQCIISGSQCRSIDILNLATESSVRIYGTIEKLPEGKSAIGKSELKCDHVEILGKSPSGPDAFSTKFNTETSADQLLDQRHLVIRGDQASACLKFRAIAMKEFRNYFESRKLTEVNPPLMVQSQAEGGSSVFEFDYHGERAYLTQSSQLYLETVLPSVGDAYCITQSFRAENSHTRRHLSEFTHCEAELAFITFEELLDFIEDMIVTVIENIMRNPEAASIINQLNPDFVIPKKPFRRMKYTDAIQWLNDHKVLKEIIDEDGNITYSPFKVGDDIPEGPERKMTDAMNEPILLCKFPANIKAFYMKKCVDDPSLTESVDVLMPGVGEITGGSMRISDYDELLSAYERENIDPKNYYWFTDQRKYGTCEHGGFGLGMERFLTWMLNRHTVREVCLYPRFIGRCHP